MATFTFTSPDGKKYTVNGPDGATQEQAFAMLQQQLGGAKPSDSQPTTPRDALTAEGEGLRAEGEAYQGFGLGLPEGLKRAWGGVKQLGADVSDAAGLFFKGKPYMSAPDRMGISQPLPTSAGSQATAEENARQQAATAAVPENLRPSYQVGAGTSQLAAQSAIPIAGEAGLTAGLGRTTTFLGNALRQTGLGAAGGAASFDPQNDKGKDIALGSLLGAGLSVLNPVAAYSAIMNRIGRATNAASQATQGVLREAQPAMQFGQGDNPSPTFAMATGAPTARSMEAGSFNGTLQNKYAELSDHYLTRFDQEMSQANPGNGPLDDHFIRARQNAENALSNLRRQASTAYDQGMQQASVTAKTVDNLHGPGSSSVPAQGLRNQLDLVYAQDTDPIAGSHVMPKDWMETLRTVLGNANNELSAKDTAGVLRRLTNLQQDQNPEVRALASKLRDSFEQDLDNIPKGNANDPAVQQIVKTRAGYKQAHDQIRAIEDSTAYRFLGVGANESNITPQALTARFSALDPAKQKQVADYMRQNTPDMLQLMRRQVVTDAVQAAKQNVAPASNSQVDIGGLVDSIFKNGNVRSSALWNADELKMLESFRAGARIIGNVGQKVTGGAGQIVGPAEVAPNLISMNPIFGARQVARYLQGSKGADLFTDPKLYSIFQRMNRATDGPTQAALRNAAVQYVTSRDNEQNQTPVTQ